MDWLYTYMYEYGYTALFITMTLENMNIPIPSEVVLGFAGFLVSVHVFEFWPAVAIATLAGITGSLISYAIGYYGGRPLLLRHSERIWLPKQHLHQADSWFRKYGGISVFTGRLLPGIRTFISLPAGMAKYPLRPFTIYTLLGTIPWTILLIKIGAMLGDNWQTLLEYDVELIVASILIVGIIWLIHRYRHPSS